MSTPLSKMPKPKADQYADTRKLFLVPTYLISPDAPKDAQQLIEQYWSEVRNHIHNLERSLGQVSHIYHEALYIEGDDGMKFVESMNPYGSSFIQAMCQSTAHLEPTEDRALFEESTDWQRCISIGLMSDKVASTAMNGYQETTRQRFIHIGKKIDETLKKGETGALFIREDHKIQFTDDIQVFYVAPPSLDAIKRWIDDQVRSVTKGMGQSQKTLEDNESADNSETAKTDTNKTSPAK